MLVFYTADVRFRQQFEERQTELLRLAERAERTQRRPRRSTTRAVAWPRPIGVKGVSVRPVAA
jgi:hypothetical protein